jgi:peptidoglycan-associated lipoprotein
MNKRIFACKEATVMKNKRRQGFVIVGLSVLMLAAVGCQQQRREPTAVKDLAPIYYDLDKSAIKSEYQDTLNSNAEWLKAHDKASVVIEGNCDERGSSEYNIALGWRRAESAKRYLSSLGVADGRLQTKSYGKERPTCNESSESCWWKNRRSDFKSN